MADSDKSCRNPKKSSGPVEKGRITRRNEKIIVKYRLGRERVMQLGKAFGESGCSRNVGSSVGGGLSHVQQMGLAVRYFATGSNFKTIAETQEVSTTTVSQCVEDVSNFFYQYSNRYIRWPHTMFEKFDMAEGFQKNHLEKPAVLGCLDGTHIQIVPPNQDRRTTFLNRKGFYSLNAMVVCDFNNKITHLDPSFAGSASDSYIFDTSLLKEDAESGRWENFFLLGDSGYRPEKYLFTPYHRPQTRTEKLYNVWHESTISVVKRTIDSLKQRWRCLDASGGYLNQTPENAARIITTCVCLHNIAVDDQVPILDHLDDDPDCFMHYAAAPGQPRDFNRGRGVYTQRDLYARIFFGPTTQEENGE